jgi:hypothetical protein
MNSNEQKKCTFCGSDIDNSDELSPFAEAGEWLAVDVWQDNGDLCRQCLENRGRLAMMYMHDKNR